MMRRMIAMSRRAVRLQELRPGYAESGLPVAVRSIYGHGSGCGILWGSAKEMSGATLNSAKFIREACSSLPFLSFHEVKNLDIPSRLVT